MSTAQGKLPQALCFFAPLYFFFRWFVVQYTVIEILEREGTSCRIRPLPPLPRHRGRLSGPESYAVAARVFHPANPNKNVEEAKGYTALFGSFVEGDDAFDEGVALFFREPHSYTAEDVVELSCHGGSAVARRLVEACIAAGAAPAAPGEYTRRAFLNGKMSLTQAEAVMDIISADGKQGAALANASLSGALAKKNGAKKEALTGL